MGKILKIIILVILIILLSILSILLSKSENQSRGDYMWTKAICNSSNYCQDYEISCKNENLVQITPTGSVIKFPANWEDPRSEESRKKLC